MNSKLKSELKMTKGFPSIQEELFLSVMRTAWANQAVISEVLRRKNLTIQQYNVLRILRGAGDRGMSCGEISNRMVTHDSDVTRLIDKLVKSGFARRERSEADRRVVYCFIEEPALEILADLDSDIVEAENSLYVNLTEKQCRTLIDLLERARP